MADLLSLTPGLLISMAYRMDHAFGADFGANMFLPETKPLAERQKETIDKVWQEYVDAYQGIPIQSQRLEECTGGGFYGISQEADYCSWAMPEALEYAKLLVKRFEDLKSLIPARPSQA